MSKKNNLVQLFHSMLDPIQKERMRQFEEELPSKLAEIRASTRSFIENCEFSKAGAKLDLVVPNTHDEINERVSVMQREIGEWAFRNFGYHNNNYSKLTPEFGYPTIMGNLTSLMGMAEELGELGEAGLNHNDAACDDALADLTIYFLDFCTRSDITVTINAEQYESMLDEKIINGIRAANRLPLIYNHYSSTESLSVKLGKLFHVNLKAHQGIRGLNNAAAYTDANKAAALDLFLHLLCITANQIVPITEKVWAKVKQRDWEKNPSDAHIVAEQTKPDNSELQPAGVVVQDAMDEEMCDE